MNKNIFALDIGTRSVTGIILKMEQNEYIIDDFCVKEHNDRAMVDGQIHDVVEVANVIRHVKEELEQRHGPLSKCSVAAAGRALKTVLGVHTMELNKQPITNQETIHYLELSAVQDAQTKLAHSGDDYKNYYCVGYSVMHTTLDNEKIGSLIDQRGNLASVEVIATFLPKIVIESLISALERSNLQMEALTLEPIAAINVLIPQSMRRLNIALIDIGAGTSDIAITEQSTVVAYGMVPKAGDLITETVSDRYLLDFPVAEQAKKEIVLHEKYVVQDILGFETTITYDQLIHDIDHSIEVLANALATEVIELNNKPPQAVMLIGGGSLTPKISDLLASKLHLPKNRVAIRGLDAIEHLKIQSPLPMGPDFVTPIGIAISAEQNPIHYINIKVNGILIRMFEMKQLTIGDALIQAGIEINKYYGKPGLAAIIRVDNRQITLPGTYGKPPTLYVNNTLQSVDYLIQDGDDIRIKQGQDGRAAKVTINELLGEIPVIDIYFNDKKYRLKTDIKVNNQVEKASYLIKDKDTIQLEHTNTVDSFLNMVKFEEDTPFFVWVNSEKTIINSARSQIYVNDMEVPGNYRFRHDDQLTIKPGQLPTVKDLLTLLGKEHSYTANVLFNEEGIELKQTKFTIQQGDTTLSLDGIIYHEDQLIITKNEYKPFIFQDIFNYVDVDLNAIKPTYKLYINNNNAAFHDPISTGDKLQLIVK